MARKKLHELKYFQTMADMFCAFRFITIKSFALACKISEPYARTTLWRYEKSGILRSGYSRALNANFYLASPELRGHILDLKGDTFSIVIDINRIKEGHMWHDYMLQICTINQSPNWYRTAFIYLPEPDQTTTKIPDLLVLVHHKENRETIYKLAIEVEIAPKNNIKINNFYANHIQAMREKSWDFVYVFAVSQMACSLHKRMLASKNVNEYVFQKSGDRTKYKVDFDEDLKNRFLLLDYTKYDV